MKLKKLIFAGLLIAAFTTTTLQAQSYNTAFGVRLGYDSGLSLKHFFAPSNAGGQLHHSCKSISCNTPANVS
jgi:hypothetical protein